MVLWLKHVIGISKLETLYIWQECGNWVHQETNYLSMGRGGGRGSLGKVNMHSNLAFIFANSSLMKKLSRSSIYR